MNNNPLGTTHDHTRLATDPAGLKPFTEHDFFSDEDSHRTITLDSILVPMASNHSLNNCHLQLANGNRKTIEIPRLKPLNEQLSFRQATNTPGCKLFRSLLGHFKDYLKGLFKGYPPVEHD